MLLSYMILLGVHLDIISTLLACSYSGYCTPDDDHRCAETYGVTLFIFVS